ncbi:MAG: hypothetical protein J2P27_02055 [Actinobacteria bacterium]|nr:hypothetical protein [Actinomycetota bacterium]
MAVWERVPLPYYLRRRGAHAQPAAISGRGLADWTRLVDICLAAALGLAVLLAHDVPYLLSHPLWVDEAWVADIVRAPVGLTRSLASSTPLGWAYLLHLVPFGGPERLRLVPLVFTMLAAAAGYLLGRELRLDRFITGILTGAAVLLSPAMLVHDELKQYTAEACACLVLLILVARVENEWRIQRLAAIAVVSSVGLLFSNTVIFVGVAAMVGLGLECLVNRSYRRLADVGLATVGMLIVSLVIYVTLIRPAISPSLVQYWAGYYVPTHSVHGALSYINLRLVSLAPYAGFGRLVVDAVGVLAGIAALIWLKRFALAAMFPVILAIVIGASAAGKYPFGDLRTSTFWLVMPPVLMAVAVATAGSLARHFARLAPKLVAGAVPVLIAAAALAIWVPATERYVRSHLLPAEDVQAQVAYLDRHFRHGDVVIVNFAASYGFAYYYPPTPSLPAGPGPDGHVVAYPSRPWIVLLAPPKGSANGLQADGVNGIAEARAKIAAEPARSRGRIWIISSHARPSLALTYERVLAGQHVQVIRVGPEPILLYDYQPGHPGL